jgi:hypothetical protein
MTRMVSLLSLPRVLAALLVVQALRLPQAQATIRLATAPVGRRAGLTTAEPPTAINGASVATAARARARLDRARARLVHEIRRGVRRLSMRFRL